MSGYSIGEVADLLRVKPHILRYWEQEVDLLSPTKDDAGRRSYSRRDLALLYRLKYLVYTRKFTVDGAGKRLLAELEGAPADSKARIQETRNVLLGLRERIRGDGDRARAVDLVPAAVVEWLRRRLAEPHPRITPTVRRPSEPTAVLQRHGNDLLRRGRVAAVIRLDHLTGDLCQLPYVPVTPIRGASLLQLWAEQIRRTAYASGRTPLLVLAVDEKEEDHLRAHLRKVDYHHVPKNKVVVAPVPRFPVVAEPSKLILDERDRTVRYPGGLAGLLWTLSAGDAAARLESRDVLVFAPVANPFVDLFSPQFVALASQPWSQICFRVVPGAERPRSAELADIFAVSRELLAGEWERGLQVVNDLRTRANDAETRTARIRLSRGGLAATASCTVLRLPRVAEQMFRLQARTLDELVEELVSAMARYGAAMLSLIHI